MATCVPDLGIATLAGAYRTGRLTIPAVIEDVLTRIAAAGDDHVWISRVADDDLRVRADVLQRLQETAPAEAAALPLLGIPFAVKDSIDFAGLPTTAACPAFAYEPAASAPIVDRLLAAGAICVGKTNLDQFASGLVGVRTPYGVSRNPFSADHIPGGSSSGSAVAVSAGLVSFSLGTDAAGSGRVPAALTNIVGLKPTRGIVSTLGCVPACQSIDCPSVFALSCADAWRVLDVIAGPVEGDPYSRHEELRPGPVLAEAPFRFAVPRGEDLRFEGDASAEALFHEALAVLEGIGGTRVELDYTPFREAAELLYEGPWVADRLRFLGEFLARHAGEVHPVTYEIITGAGGFSAVDAFAAMHELAVLKTRAARALRDVDALVVPTTPTTYTVAAVEADPIELNRRLGYYTNFVNLLDLSALAVPSGFRHDGMPLGITLIGPALHDAVLASLGARFMKARGGVTGAAGRPARPDMAARPSIEVAVVGAHLSGEAKNGELRDLGAAFVSSAKTAAEYALVVLEGFDPPRPGLVRVGGERGAAIEAEVWAMPPEAVGRLVETLPPPLTIGTVALDDGHTVKGFLCEQHATTGCEDITHLGGWRHFAGRHGPEPPGAREPDGDSAATVAAGGRTATPG